MEYKETKWEFIYAGSDGELYTTYYPGFTKKKSKMRKGLKIIRINVRRNKKYVSVAKEIALAFIPNPNNYRYVKEKDGDQMNTHPDNLYWSKSNRMDYNAFAEKKKGMVYKSYVGKITGDYIVTEDNTSLCTLSCINCGDTKIIERKKVKNTVNCFKCREYPLDINALNSKYFKEWDILKENGTEKVRAREGKELLIKCKCCNQKEIISYENFKKRKTIYYCDITRKNRRILSRKLYQMKRRCYNEECKSYKTYGGRGIRVCEEWLNDKESFIKWSLKNGFDSSLEIDRIDGYGNYEPSNCQYITKKENSRKQVTKLFTDEEARKIKYSDWGSLNCSQIADELGFNKEREKYGRAIWKIINNKGYKHI